jgi:YVTN family beta-propeller protein
MRTIRTAAVPLIVFLLLAAVTPMQAQAQSDLSGTLIVANRTGGSVSLFDLDTNTEIARLPVGPQIPHEVAVSPDGRTAATGAYGGGNDPGRCVVLIDVAEARIRGSVDLGPVSRPHSLAFLPDGRRLVATMEAADRLALIDIATLAVVKTYPTGGREGHMVRVSSDGAYAYVASRGAEGTLSVISLWEDLAPIVIPTGNGAEGLAVSPDGTEVWVANRNAGSISIVNTATRQVSATLPAEQGAGRVEISAGGRVLVPNGTSARALDKYLTIYDLASRRQINQLSVGEADGGPGAFSILLLGERAFIADRALRSIALYDLVDLSLERTLAVDHPDPDGMAYSPIRVSVFD